MTAPTATLARAPLLRRGLHLEYLTVGWNIAEGLIAIAAGLAAGSIALIGFGVDSFVETLRPGQPSRRGRFRLTMPATRTSTP